MSEIKILFDGGEDEIVEKKSRFIATVRPVESEEEALAFIAEMKKKYWNARHNCFSYVIGDRQQLQRCSDDGEPQGTAGRPMLDVLLGEDVHNVCVVVTRYFGGVLLGTGGLVRAYQQAVKVGLEATTIITRTDGFALTIRTDYNGIGKIQYILGQRGLKIVDSRYTDIVEIDTLVTTEQMEEVTAAITEATAAKATFPEKKEVQYAFIDGEALLLS